MPVSRIIQTRPVFPSAGAESRAPGASVFYRFLAQSGLTPDAVALSWANGELTCAQLRGRAEHAGAVLRERGVEPEARVAILGVTVLQVVPSLVGMLAGEPGFAERHLEFWRRTLAAPPPRTGSPGAQPSRSAALLGSARDRPKDRACTTLQPRRTGSAPSATRMERGPGFGRDLARNG